MVMFLLLHGKLRRRANEKDDSLLLTVSIDKALDKDVSVVLDFSGSATKNVDYGGAFIDRYQTNKFLTFGSRLTVNEGNTYRIHLTLLRMFLQVKVFKALWGLNLITLEMLM